MVLRVALPRRLRALPARAPMTSRLPARSCLRSFAERTLILTLVPPLTFLKVENSALLAVVRTRRRTSDAPLGTATVTGTPVVPTAAAVNALGAATRAAATRCAASGAPASGPAAAIGAPAEAAEAFAGGSPAGMSLTGSVPAFSRMVDTRPPRAETAVTHVQSVVGIADSRTSTDQVWSGRTSAVPIFMGGLIARPL